MPTTDISPASLADIPPTPEERFRELTAILAAGLLRLRTRPGPAPGADISGPHAVQAKPAESGGTPLASART
jgi:hypothetical protein